MRWISRLPFFRAKRLSVIGLDLGPQGCSLVVLSGSSKQPDSVCCAERLHVPEALLSHGEVLKSAELGQWLRAYLAEGDYQPQQAYLGLDSACVTNHLVTLPAGLSPDDVAFQLQLEVQSLQAESAPQVWIDYELDNEASPAGTQRYCVQAAPRLRVEALQRVAHHAGLNAQVVEPRHASAQRAARREVLASLPQASTALALQCDEAFGLALRAWCNEGMNFLPHRQETQRLLRRAWLLGMAVCAVGGAILAGGFAMVMASVAHAQYPASSEVVATTRELDDARKVHAQARWLETRQALQQQSLQWSRVLSQSSQGVWVSTVKQQGARWMVQGEALSSTHAQRLVKQLQALDIWTQAPTLPHLQVMPAVSATGVPVWQFRIEGDLKVGV